MIGESLLLLKELSRSHVTCKALRHFPKKIHSSCNESYKIEYKVTVMVIILFSIVITVHKYEENNVDFIFLLKMLQTW